jgi:hypothetical protein
MTPQRRKQVSELYQAIIAQEEDQRAAYLAAASGEDGELRREVESLLAKDRALSQPRPTPEDVQAVSSGTAQVLTPGSRFGRYRIEGTPGTGGMGVVYFATDLQLDRPVAVKFLNEEVGTLAARRRFQLEAKTASSLSHPHILTVYEAGEFEGAPYLVTEYAASGTLRAWARQVKPGWQQLANILAGVADGLACAHEAGILHRDIKPENILVTKSGHAKLADFGLAKLIEETDSGASETRTVATQPGMVLGTLAYMSPEQTAGRPVDARSDIFSFGVVLYEMVSGKRLFGGSNSVSLVHAIAAQDPEPLPSCLPVNVRMVVDKALEKDPADRYQTIRDLAVDLLRAVRSREVAPGTETVTGTTSRRRWAALYAASGALATGLFTFALWQIPFVRERVTSSEPMLRPEARVHRLTHYTGTERESALSPDGKYFAFVSDRGGSPDIWVRQVSGGDPVRITNDAPAESDLVYSADGESIYFAVAGSGPPSIWRVGTLGGAPRKLIDRGVSPAPSPEGDRIAFIRDGNSVLVSDANGTGVRTLVETPRIAAVAWSPDGRWLAYTTGALFGVSQIHLIDAQGENGRQVTHFTAGTIRALAWAPDSRHLYVSRNYDLGWLPYFATRSGSTTPPPASAASRSNFPRTSFSNFAPPGRRTENPSL